MADMNPSLILRDNDDPLKLGVGREFFESIGFQARPNGGTVMIEIFDFAQGAEGAWVHPADPEYTITEDNDGFIKRASRAPHRITCLDGAVMTLFGSIR